MRIQTGCQLQGYYCLSVGAESSGIITGDWIGAGCWSAGGEQVSVHFVKSALFLARHCLLSSSVNPPAGGQYISPARLSFAQLFRQSDFSSAKLTAVKGQTLRSNRVIRNRRMMNPLWPESSGMIAV